MHKKSLKCVQVDEDVHVSVTVTSLKETTSSLTGVILPWESLLESKKS